MTKVGSSGCECVMGQKSKGSPRNSGESAAESLLWIIGMSVDGWLKAGVQESVFPASVVTEKGKKGTSSIRGKRETNSHWGG
jgi:hypothetical protein